MIVRRVLLTMPILLALLAGAGAPASADDGVIVWTAGAVTAAEDTELVKPKRAGRAALEVFGVNALVWSYDRFIREGGENPVFRIGFDSWRENLEAGWNWDDNNFATNQFAHPYHGSLYFNAARSNGFTYWESVPFTFAGSWMWEYLGETHHPALNDWVSTAVGGVALGEITHRLATTIRDNEATGAERNWREVGAMLVDPMGGLNRIIDGDWARRGLNDPKRFPKNYRSRMDVGLRTRGEEKLWEADTTDVYVAFDFEYGDPFFGDLGDPFDTFDFAIELYFGDKTSVADVQGSGNLAGVFLKETEAASHILGAFQHYDYVNTNALEFGGQSITAGLLSRFETSQGMELRTALQVGPVLLGGASSDHESVSGRSYDYGPGSTARFSAWFARDGWRLFEISHEQFWIHSISGNRVDHHISRSTVRAAVPLKYNIRLGLEYRLELAERDYQDYEDVSVRNPQARVFLRWILN
jgi:hypothetical protein